MQKKKNTWHIGIIFMVVMLFLQLTTHVSAQTGTTINFNPATSNATTCATHQISVFVNDVIDLTGYHLEISFDPAVVAVTDVVNGGFLDGALEEAFYEPTNEIDNINGKITFGMAQQGTNGDPVPKTGSGALITITMQALVPNDSTTFQIDAINSMLVDWPDVFEIPFTLSGDGVVNTRSCAPTDISLSNNTIAENQAIGTQIGTLGSTDPDPGDLVFSYTLVDDINYPDNQYFSISGNSLLSDLMFDFEAKSSYLIKIRTTDPWGETYDEEFTITITDLNDPPVLTPIGDKFTYEGVVLSFTVIATDQDIPADTLTYSLVGAPAGATIDPVTGAFSWTPTEAQGPGSYTFEVCVSDGTNTVCEEITVTVAEVSSAPSLAPIGDQSVDELSALSFTAVGSDADIPADTLTYSLVGAPAGATIDPVTGAFSWTPTEAQGPGSYTFEVCVSDGTNTVCEEITVTVAEVNQAPIGTDDFYTTLSKQTLIVTMPGVLENDYDLDLPANTLVSELVSSLPTGEGSLILAADGGFAYVPPTDWYGSTSFTYRVFDGVDYSENVTVTIAVDAPPVAYDQSISTPEDTQLQITLVGTDAEGSPLTYIMVSGPTHGSYSIVDNVVTYTPAANFFGSDSFTYKVNDGLQDSNIATVTITVTPVNDAPIANSQSVITDQDVAVEITLTGSDVENDPLTWIILTQPEHGTLVCNANVCTYTPDIYYSGTDSFTFWIFDGNNYSNIATVNISINQITLLYYFPLIMHN